LSFYRCFSPFCFCLCLSPLCSAVFAYICSAPGEPGAAPPPALPYRSQTPAGQSVSQSVSGHRMAPRRQCRAPVGAPHIETHSHRHAKRTSVFLCEDMACNVVPFTFPNVHNVCKNTFNIFLREAQSHPDCVVEAWVRDVPHGVMWSPL